MVRKVLVLVFIGTLFLRGALPLQAQAVRELDITATVPAHAGEADIVVTPSRPQSDTLSANEEVTYTIEYKSEAAGSWPFTIEASWTQGLIEGTSATYVESLEYKLGSASDTDTGDSPVIDLSQRTITWEISSLAPSSTYHEVEFTLKVPSDLASDQRSTATVVIGGALNDDSLQDESFSVTVYQSSITPTPTSAPSSTPTPGPTATPTPSTTKSTPVLSPTPSPLPPIPVLSNVELRQITNTSAVVIVTTQEETSSTLNYGTSPTSLTESVRSLDFLRKRDISLTGLTPNTSYYFRITSTTRDGRQSESDIFTFKTSRSDEIISLSDADITFASRNILLSAQGHNATQIIPVITTPHTSLTISMRIDNPEAIESVVARLENAQILGITTFASEPPIQEVRLLELFPGVFSGELRTPAETGQYRVVLRVRDTEGGFSTSTLPQPIHVSPYLRVVDKNSNSPIEKAIVTFRKKVERLGMFIPLESALSYTYETDHDGNLNLVLPAAEYEITINALGYGKIIQIIDFRALETYPTFSLTPSFSLGDYASYYYFSLKDTGNHIQEAITALFISQRGRDASMLFVVGSIFVCGLFLVSLRLHTSMLAIPLWILEHLADLFGRVSRVKPYKRFIVYEGNNYHKSLASTHLVVMDRKNRVIASKKTDLIGKVDIPIQAFKKAAFPLTLFTYHRGYSSYPTYLDERAFAFLTINLFMTKEVAVRSTSLAFIEWLTDLFFIFTSDILLMLVIMVTLLVVLYQGVFEALPYIVMSSLLIVFWFLYLYQIFKFHREEKSYSP